MHKQAPSNRLQELREAHDLERYDIAAELRVDQSTVYRWEKGGNVPDAAKRSLASRYDVSVEHLMGWDREPSAPERSGAAA